MKKELDFETRLPPLRWDVESVPVVYKNREWLQFHDPAGYMPGPFTVDRSISVLFPMLDGRFSIRDMVRELGRYGVRIKEKDLGSIIRKMDKAGLMQSERFLEYKCRIDETFENEDHRLPVCAGNSYPDDKKKLVEMLDSAFGRVSKNTEAPSPSTGPKIKALFAPHIDPRVGLSGYVSAFRPVAGERPARVVVLATAHYAGAFGSLYDGMPFIASRKSFETPLGVVSADRQALDLLERDGMLKGCSFQDRAHRMEHSIELPLIFLQYLWPHSFEILPILVGSFDDLHYFRNGDTGKKLDAMSSWLRSFFGEDEETFFLISGDLCHFGKKFGDNRAASEMFGEAGQFDRQFLSRACAGEPEEILHLITDKGDPFRICGFPPLLTALNALQGMKGEVLSYERWDEREKESAVTFGSVLYRRAD